MTLLAYAPQCAATPGSAELTSAVQSKANLWHFDHIVAVRDLAEERYATTGCTDWSTLSSVCEEMLSGQRDEGELAMWCEQYEVEL